MFKSRRHPSPNPAFCGFPLSRLMYPKSLPNNEKAARFPSSGFLLKIVGLTGRLVSWNQPLVSHFSLGCGSDQRGGEAARRLGFSNRSIVWSSFALPTPSSNSHQGLKLVFTSESFGWYSVGFCMFFFCGDSRYACNFCRH